MYYFLHCCKGSTLSSYYDKVHIKAPHPKGGTLVFFFQVLHTNFSTVFPWRRNYKYSEPIKLD